MIFVTVSGHLGKDAELRKTSGGDSVCSFSVASSRKVKGNEETAWIRCSLWGKRGEALSQYLSKGNAVTVVGEFSTREHDGKTYLECRVAEIALQGGRGKSEGGPRKEREEKTAKSGGGYDDADYGGSDDDDQIPF